MRKITYVFLGLAIGFSTQCAMAAPNAACSAAGNDFQAAAFSSPAKPSQARVLGAAGQETSGPQFSRMMQAIRTACDSDDPARAVHQAAIVEALLHRRKGPL